MNDDVLPHLNTDFVRLVRSLAVLGCSILTRRDKAGRREEREQTKTMCSSALSYSPDFVRQENKTSSLFEAKLLRDQIFVASSSQIHSSLFRPYPGGPSLIPQFSRFALYGRSEGFLSSPGYIHIGAIRDLPGLFTLGIFTCTWSG